MTEANKPAACAKKKTLSSAKATLPELAGAHSTQRQDDGHDGESAEDGVKTI